MLSKAEFLKVYRPKIQMIFDDRAFWQNQSIKITEKRISLKEIQAFYVPKYTKNGIFDPRSFEQQFDDPDVKSLRLKQVSEEPEKWGLAQMTQVLLLDSLDPIPVATDLLSGSTLILDSNHTLANIHSLNKRLSLEEQIAIVEVVGQNLAPIIQDFYILNRKK